MKKNLALIGILVLTAFAMAIFTGCSHKKTVGVKDTAAPTVALRDNIVEFVRYLSLNNVTYISNGQYSITSGQPWGGINISESDGSSIVNARAGRKASAGPAQWFKGKANVAFCVNGDRSTPFPKELNFAFEGTLIIDGNSYQLVTGQGNDGIHNNWWIGGGSGWTTDGISLITPDKKYAIAQLDMSSNEFYVQPTGGHW